MVTPLPPQSPSHLTTIGPSQLASKASASRSESIRQYLGVRTMASLQILRPKTLLPSSFAAAAVGPTVGIPSECNLSASPATSGASGPIVTRSAVSRTWATTSSIVVQGTRTQEFTRELPALGSMTDFIAFSRLPLPTTAPLIHLCIATSLVGVDGYVVQNSTPQAILGARFSQSYSSSGLTRIILSSPAAGEPRPSVLLVVRKSMPSGPTRTVRMRPNWPLKCSLSSATRVPSSTA